jgi:hypothetical protein
MEGLFLARRNQLFSLLSSQWASSPTTVLVGTTRQAEIAGIALSTTSLAVVYAVLVETGLNQTVIGKRLMSATFVTDFGTAAALSILFIKPTVWIAPFVVVSLGLVFGLPRLSPWFFSRYGDRVIEPEIKLDELPLRPAPERAGADARRRLCVPHALLPPQGRDERVGGRSGQASGPSGCSSPERWCR